MDKKEILKILKESAIKYKENLKDKLYNKINAKEILNSK